MIKRIIARIRKLWDKEQDVAIESTPVEIHQEEYSEPILIYVQRPIALIRPKVTTPRMSWEEFKTNNAIVNQYFSRHAI